MTNDCNLACPYCYVDKSTTYMTFEIGKKVIEYCHQNLLKIKEKYKDIEKKVANTDQLKNGINFFGGEPLLNFIVLKQMVEYAEEKYPHQWNWAITTNGTLLTEEICAFFHQYKFDVCLSWDGKKEDQDKQRPFRYNQNISSYDILMQKIPILLKYRPYKNLMIRATVTKDNVSHFYENYKLFENYGFLSFAFDLEYFTNWTEELLNILKLELDKVYRDRALIYMQNKKPSINFVLSTLLLKEYIKGQLEILLDLPIYIEKTPSVYTHCGYGLEAVVVNGKGNLYPCHEEPDFKDNRYSNLIGNIDTGINFEKLEQLRENIKLVEQKFLDNRTCYKDCIIKQYHLKCAYTTCPANLLQRQEVTTYNCNIKKHCLELLLKYSNMLFKQSTTFIQLLENFPVYQVYKDILSQPEGNIRNMYIQKYKQEYDFYEGFK